MKKIFVVSMLAISLVTVSLLQAPFTSVTSVHAQESSKPANVFERMKQLLLDRKEKTVERTEKVNTLQERKAKEATSSLELRQKNLSTEQQKRFQGLKQSIDQRFRVHEKLINHISSMFEKIQTRVDAAKSSGKDVAEIENLVAGSTDKLEDAKTKMSEISVLKEDISEKETAVMIQEKFVAVRKDLKSIRENLSKIIRSLKSFNSATSSNEKTQVTDE